MSRKLDLRGKRFGRLTAIKATNRKSGGNIVWECQCDCGKTTFVPTSCLPTGRSKSCGCFSVENPSRRTHGMSNDTIYNIWSNILKRVENKKNPAYEYYGGRGIKVCKKWHTFSGFWEDMEEGYGKELTIDRIDNNGNYCKENCRWATRKEQARNRRTNRLITYNGKTQCLVEWSEELKISISTLKHRLDYGWSIEKALTTKAR